MIKVNIKHKAVFITRDYTWKTTYECNGHWNDRTYVWSIKRTTTDLVKNELKENWTKEFTWKCTEEELINRITECLAWDHKKAYMTIK